MLRVKYSEIQLDSFLDRNVNVVSKNSQKTFGHSALVLNLSESGFTLTNITTKKIENLKTVDKEMK